MASLLDPYEDLNIDLDDTVEGILSTRRKKDKRSEYLLESRLNPYSIWSAAKPKMADATEQSYRDLGARNPMISKDAIASSTPLWSTLEWFPGTGIGTKAVGMVGGVASTALKSKATMELIEKAKGLGMTSQKKITEYVDPILKKMFGTGQNIQTTRKLSGKYDPKKGEWVPYPGVNKEAVLQNIDAIRMGGDPVRIKEKEDFLEAVGVKLPDKSNPKYKDNLRMKYKYWSDDEWRIKTLAHHSSIKSKRAAARRQMIEKSGTENLPEHLQKQMARDRARSVVRNMRLEDESRGGGFHLTDKEIDKLKAQLIPVKLKEIQEGTPLLYRMTIDHYHPRHGAVVRGGQEIGSGLTTWKNITDSNGKLRLISFKENIEKSNIIPGRLLHPEQKSWRKLPPKTSIVDLL